MNASTDTSSDTGVLLLTSFKYPSRYAHPQHGLMTARAFSKEAPDRFLFVISRSEDDALLEGIPHVSALGSADWLLKKLHLRTAAYALWLPLFLLRRDSRRFRKGIIMTNDPNLLAIAVLFRPLFGYRVLFEAHGKYSGWQRATVFTAADKVAFVTRALESWALDAFPRLAGRTGTFPNAVDLRAFLDVTESRDRLRAALGLPLHGILVGYIGRLRPLGIEKGVANMIHAAAALPQEVTTVFIGGTREEIDDYRAQAGRDARAAGRIVFVPHVAPEKVPMYAKACDILAYVPPYDSNDFFARETSPMKLFEYMAAERPFIISNMPTFREVVGPEEAFVVEPGDTQAYVKAVESIIREPENARARVRAASESVRNYTLEARAAALLAFADNRKGN